MTQVEQTVARVDGLYLEDKSPLSDVDSTKAIIAGELVRSYDNQIGDYNQELVSLNALKKSFRDNKIKVGNIKAQPVHSREEEGGLTTEVRMIDEDQQAYLAEIAEEVGIDSEELNLKSGFISEENLDSITEAIDAQIKNLNSTSELKMIYFQSVIDARKQAMLMLSNLLKADSDTKSAIIQNMK